MRFMTDIVKSLKTSYKMPKYKVYMDVIVHYWRDVEAKDPEDARIKAEDEDIWYGGDDTERNIEVSQEL